MRKGDMDDLLKHMGDIDINEKNEDGLTSLHRAVINNDFELVQWLLDQGADANQKTHASEDDVPIKCECPNPKYCHHICDEFGLELKDGKVVGQNALHLAAKYGSEELVERLLHSVVDVNDASDDGSTALHYATQNCSGVGSHVGVTKLLLSYGAEIDAQNQEGKTPLYLAVKLEKTKLVSYLLSRGANVNSATRNLSTPLFSSLINCNSELARLLLKSEASPTARNRHNEQPLFFVLRVVGKGDDRLQLVALLLDGGVDVDARNGHGSTALHLAVQDRDAGLAELLLQRGCSIDAKDCFDTSALATAVCTNLKDLAGLLLSRGANVNDFVQSSSVLEHAIIRRNEAMVRLLLEHGADVNVGSGRNKPVAAACLHKNTRIVQMLIDRGADINYKDKNGRTPLMRAIKEPNYTMMRHLLERGACVNERDYRGNTAFHVLFENNTHTKENIIEYLLDEGADLNIENDSGHTPFRCMMFKCFTKGEVFIFVKHVALLVAQKLYVNPKIMKYLCSDNVWSEYMTSCQQELERMKSVKVTDKCSYFEIVVKKHSLLKLLFQDENVLAVFTAGIRKNKFINYSGILMRNFRRKSERFELLRKGMATLTDVFRCELPPEIVEKICQYLTNKDLKVYVDHT